MTKQQEAFKKIEALRAKDPSLSVAGAAKRAGVRETAYYMEKAKRAGKGYGKKKKALRKLPAYTAIALEDASGADDRVMLLICSVSQAREIVKQ